MWLNAFTLLVILVLAITQVSSRPSNRHPRKRRSNAREQIMKLIEAATATHQHQVDPLAGIETDSNVETKNTSVDYEDGDEEADDLHDLEVVENTASFKTIEEQIAKLHQKQEDSDLEREIIPSPVSDFASVPTMEKIPVESGNDDLPSENNDSFSGNNLAETEAVDTAPENSEEDKMEEPQNNRYIVFKRNHNEGQEPEPRPQPRPAMYFPTKRVVTSEGKKQDQDKATTKFGSSSTSSNEDNTSKNDILTMLESKVENLMGVVDKLTSAVDKLGNERLSNLEDSFDRVFQWSLKTEKEMKKNGKLIEQIKSWSPLSSSSSEVAMNPAQAQSDHLTESSLQQTSFEQFADDVYTRISEVFSRVERTEAEIRELDLSSAGASDDHENNDTTNIYNQLSNNGKINNGPSLRQRLQTLLTGTLSKTGLSSSSPTAREEDSTEMSDDSFLASAVADTIQKITETDSQIAQLKQEYEEFTTENISMTHYLKAVIDRHSRALRYLKASARGDDSSVHGLNLVLDE